MTKKRGKYRKTMADQLEEEKGAVRGTHGGFYKRWGSLWDHSQAPGPVKRIAVKDAEEREIQRRKEPIDQTYVEGVYQYEQWAARQEDAT